MTYRMCTNQIAIIVLNYNQASQTICCINQILKINSGERIIIVDNASNDNSVQQIEKEYVNNKKIDFIKNPLNGGYSAGNNIGIRFAIEKYDIHYICIINPDVIIEENFFPFFMNILESNESIAAISPLMIKNEKINLSEIGWDIPRDRDIYRFLCLWKRKERQKKDFAVFSKHFLQCEAIPGSFFMIKREIFEKMNFFDENVFLYNEENILGYKLKKMNKICLVDTSHYYIHNHKKVDKNIVRKRYIYEFKKIKNDYKYGYQSRKYFSIQFMDGKYKQHITVIYYFNLFLLHLKHNYYLVMEWIRNGKN